LPTRPRRRIGLAIAATVAALWMWNAAPARAVTPDGEAALALPVPPGKALVYLVRPSEFGPTVPIQVVVNHQSIGATLARTFFVIEAAPGELRLESRADNTAELVFTAEAGQRYWVLQDARVGVLSATTGLQLAPQFLGREGVEESRLVRHVKL
jgi:hypothetical protein